MDTHTFRLIRKKIYTHSTGVFVKDAEGKLGKRNVRFSTAHLVRETDRVKKAKTVYAQAIITNKALAEAMFRDSGYGKTFILVGDEDLKLKKEPYNITPMDAERVALKNLFSNTELEFDESKPNAVLREELNIFLSATTGKPIKEGVAKEIEHKQIDVKASIDQQLEDKIKAYEETEGVDFPVFKKRGDKLNFIDGLSNPKFDKVAFIEANADQIEPGSNDESDLPSGDAEALGVIYQEKFGKKVANLKKNDAAWIEDQIRKEAE